MLALLDLLLAVAQVARSLFGSRRIPLVRGKTGGPFSMLLPQFLRPTGPSTCRRCVVDMPQMCIRGGAPLSTTTKIRRSVINL